MVQVSDGGLAGSTMAIETEVTLIVIGDDVYENVIQTGSGAQAHLCERSLCVSLPNRRQSAHLRNAGVLT